MLRLAKDYEPAIRIIESIPGMSTLSAVYIIAEIGINLPVFPDKRASGRMGGAVPES